MPGDHHGRDHATGTLAAVTARIDPAENRATATTYLRLRDLAEHRSIFTRLNDAYALEALSRHLGRPFATATMPDLMAWVEHLEALHARSTVEIRKASIRRFYRYLANPEAYAIPRLRDRLEPLPAAAWLTVHRAWRELPVDTILTLADVTALIQAARNPRDRAFVAALYESGARLSEILALDVQHVALDHLGAVLTIRRSKTTGRCVRLILAAPLLRAHLEAHPDPRPDAPLWPSEDHRAAYKHRRLRRQTPGVLLHALARRAGIRKPVNPHAFRHARATHTAGFLTEPEQRQMYGWSQGSPTPLLYVHLHGSEATHKLLLHYGLATLESPDAHAWEHFSASPVASVSHGPEREREREV